MYVAHLTFLQPATNNEKGNTMPTQTNNGRAFSGSSVSSATAAGAGKAGTISNEEFAALEVMVNKYGPETIALKVAKVCKKKADTLAHEYAASAVAASFKRVANSIKGLFPTSST